MNELSQKIISKLPYGDDFRFVDEITFVNENRIVGNYTFRADAQYYASHYPHFAVTPGVLLLECMGQIGLVAHLVYIEKIYEHENVVLTPSLSNVQASFLLPVGKGEKVLVEATKIYYRAGVLKSDILLRNSSGEECARAIAHLKFVENEK
ncbi:MAG: hypothetical protein J6S84_04555 [Bacteroidales bacterium]|nr:hypothetical protein [Bacteroidales bacterium]